MEDKRFGSVDGQGFEMRGSPSSSVGIGSMCIVACGQLHGCKIEKDKNVVEPQMLQPVEWVMPPLWNGL